MKISFLIILIVMNCFWAGSLSIYKSLSSHLDVGCIVTMRFGLAAIMLAVCWPWLPGKTPRGVDLVKTIGMGLITFMLGHRLQIWGVKHGTAGNSSVLMGMEPILTSVGAAFFLHEHIGPRRWIGFSLGMVGVLLLNGLANGRVEWVGFQASLVFMSSFLCEAAYSIMGKGLIERSGAMKTLALALISGTAANVLINGRETFDAMRVMPLNSWWQVLYLATICTAIGYAIWFVVIKETDVNVTAMTIFMQPVAGVVIAAIWLHESPHWGQFWGCAAIVAGLVIGLSRQVKSAPGKMTPNSACQNPEHEAL